MVRRSREPRRISSAPGKRATSWALFRSTSLCFIYIIDTPTKTFVKIFFQLFSTPGSRPTLGNSLHSRQSRRAGLAGCGRVSLGASRLPRNLASEPRADAGTGRLFFHPESSQSPNFGGFRYQNLDRRERAILWRINGLEVSRQKLARLRTPIAGSCGFGSLMLPTACPVRSVR